MTKPTKNLEENLFKRVAEIIEAASGSVARTVNSTMVQAYWLIGREIVVVEQQGKKRAGYGDELISLLSVRLTEQYGRGFSDKNLRKFRQFYLSYLEGSLLPTEMGGPWDKSAISTGSNVSEIRSTLWSELG